MGYGVQVGVGHRRSGHQGVCVGGCLADQAEKKLHPSPAGFSLFTVQSQCWPVILTSLLAKLLMPFLPPLATFPPAPLSPAVPPCLHLNTSTA